MKEIKKIVVIGPESTGKSTLCEKLAAHYHTTWAKEYAREYLLNNGTKYTFENLLDVAKGQIKEEDMAVGRWLLAEKNTADQASTIHYQPLFIDTDMYVMKIWCEFVFGKCHQWILDKITERRYDLYLLCNIDMAWIKDELREYPDLITREKLYHHYKDTMVNQNVPWVDISGDYSERLLKAISAVDKIL